MSKIGYVDLRREIAKYLKESPEEGVRDILGMLFCIMDELHKEKETKEELCPT